MRRFFGTLLEDNIIIDDLSEVRHIIKVNRHKVGDRIEVITGDSCFECEITSVSKKEVVCTVINQLPSKHQFDLTLIISAIKSNKLEELVRHATELGVRKIIITNTSRTAAKFRPDKLDRYKKIVLSALKQSKAFQRTEIDFVDYPNLDFSLYHEVVLLHTNENAPMIHEATDHSAIFIGPEGGFSEEELNELIHKGVKIATLGSNILRAETAALSAVSIYLHELGVM